MGFQYLTIVGSFENLRSSISQFHSSVLKPLTDSKAQSSWFSIEFVFWNPMSYFSSCSFLTWATFWCGDTGIVLLLNNNFSLAAPAVKHEHLVGSHSRNLKWEFCQSSGLPFCFDCRTALASVSITFLPLVLFRHLRPNSFPVYPLNSMELQQNWICLSMSVN